ncbi:hypothetical protein P9250_22975 [Caballeronia sp. LP006]|uniref:hypothetical protein n=1 Tax=Caballeronia sp. LP006 TaxID=3038552 RepID=UPI0028669DEB|nr:hypothetical protein [Caballeronia sp. LP006]MDR5830739.1 hypothetical protein [Caballeronia sp. LP006]
MRLLLAIGLVILSNVFSIAHADDAPRTMLRAHLEPAGKVVAGSAAQLVVDALTTTWFTAAPDWPLFDVHDAFVTLPDESAQNLSETMDGVRWFGVRRVYRIVPRAAGTFDVPPFAITLHPGGADGPVTLTTPRLELVASVPAGAEDMASFFPTPKLTVTQRIEPSDGKLEVGGTLTRAVTERAEGTESMLIPPLAFADIAGLRRYSKPPVTRNITQDRSGFVAGERTDTVAYLVERPGTYTLPAIDIEWWNTTTRAREKIHLPALSFRAHAASERPLWDIPGGLARHTVIYLDERDVMYACVALAAMALAIWFYPRMRVLIERGWRRWSAWRKARAEGEFAAWRALRKAASAGSMSRIVPALYRWMDVNPRYPRPARLRNIGEFEPSDLKRLADSAIVHYRGTGRADEAPPTRLRRHTKFWRSWRTKRPALAPLNDNEDR